MNRFEHVMVDIGKGIAWPFVHGAQLVELLDKALKDEPAVKAAVVGLIQQVEIVTADGAVVVSSNGLNLTADMAELVAAKALFAYITNTFLPAIKVAYKDIAPEIADLVAKDDAPAPAAAITGPGLHNVIPA